MLEIALKNSEILSTGVTTPQLTIPQISSLYIAVPTMEIQKKIIKKVVEIEDEIVKCKMIKENLQIEKENLFI